MRQTPPVCLARAAGLALLRRIRRDRRHIGRTFRADDGRRFTIVRHLRRTAGTGTTPPAAPVLVVRFRFARWSLRTNLALSLLPVPLIVGFPGFREKIWMADAETGLWQGVYQWESDDVAQRYQRSSVLAVLSRRAVPGSLSCSVIAHEPVPGYIERSLMP
ncbi:MAG: hypothetical protein HKP61_16475 [Dactylosporangium sp.]|nr:YdhR family protein [Dactylosporangium sp.]NNJ62503.1 hypothetical protein [Dactylosporangium sp.]